MSRSTLLSLGSSLLGQIPPSDSIATDSELHPVVVCAAKLLWTTIYKKWAESETKSLKFSMFVL